MRITEVELWVIEIADRVRASRPIEDDRVELKSEWPVPQKAAARLAAHANEARGEPALWIVGIDQKAAAIVGAKDEELADWWPQVAKCFDGGVAPDLIRHVAVPLADQVVVALLFDTARAPFVLKSGGPDRWVPWREGTAQRAATREDLIRLLVPRQRQPQVELLKGHMERFRRMPGFDSYGVTLFLYVTPMTSERLVLPFHRFSGWLTNGSRTHPLEGMTILVSRNPAVSRTDSEIVIDGPCGITFSANLEVQADTFGDIIPFDARIEIESASGGERIVLTPRFSPAPELARSPQRPTAPDGFWRADKR